MNLSPPLLLAFGFASPWLLGGLALGAVPVVIHLLHKRRYREVPWAAMRFLLAATKKNARRLRLEQFLLLAVRVLIFVLLGLALARPYVESLGSYFQVDAPTHRIIVLDATYSMGYQSAEFRRFERAKELARDIVSHAAQGDALNLVRIARQPSHVIIREPAYQPSQVIAEIDQLPRTDEPADLLASLQVAAELLGRAPEIPRKEISIISDLQAVDWTGIRQAQIHKLLADLSEKATLTLLDVGQEHASNAAVVDFFAKDTFPTTGQEIALQATVENFGPATLADQVIELYVEGRLAATQRVELPPGESVPVDFSYAFDAAGEHRLEVRIPDDGLPLDNRRWLSLPVREELNLLLVNGRQSGRDTNNATYYLQKVLSPSTAEQPWQGVMRPRVIPDGELLSTDLSTYDAVFLCNVRLLTEREADLLRAYVEGGGGLVICLGDQVQPGNYNQMLYRDGKGLLPTRLDQRKGNARQPEDAFQVDPGDLAHPIVNQYKGNDNAGLENTLALEYFAVTLPLESPATVVLRFDSGDPLLIDAPVGRGRVILYTTSVDNRWGPWPLQASFPPLMHETVRYVVAGRWAERQRRVGEPLSRTFPTRAFQMPVTVHRPDGTEETLRATEADGFAAFTYESTGRAGIYEVRLGLPLSRTELFAVNVDPVESDLTTVDERTLRADILPGVDFRYSTQWQASNIGPSATTTERGGLTRWLLWATLCLVFVEQLMAWNFHYGCVLLGVVIVAALSLQTWAVSPAGGAVILLCGLAGLVVFAWRSRRPARAGMV